MLRHLPLHTQERSETTGLPHAQPCSSRPRKRGTLHGRSHLGLLIVWLGLARTVSADPVTPLSGQPEWDGLHKFQETITHDNFAHLLDDVYAVGGTAQQCVKVEADYAEIRTTGQHWIKLKFAKDSPEPLPKYWRNPGELPANNDRPLDGLTIALDPGHLGGAWAKMEERWFQIGTTEPVTEGDLTLRTAKVLAPRLEALGAKVVFVRSRPGPLIPLRPVDLRSEARASLKARGIFPILRSYKGPADPEKEHSVAWESERLFYRVAEIHERANRVNRVLKPDLTLCLHFNAEPWGDPANPSLTDINHLHLIINGAYAESELIYADVRYQMLLKLLSQSFGEEVGIAESVARSLAEATKLPAYHYNGTNAHSVGSSGYVWARNLLANRLYHCPVAYIECYVMNSRDFFDRLQAGAYDGLQEFNGVMHKNVYAEYADGVAQGLADYFRTARGRKSER